MQQEQNKFPKTTNIQTSGTDSELVQSPHTEVLYCNSFHCFQMDLVITK